MKNTSRAGHIHGTKRPSPQVKTSQRNGSPSPAPAGEFALPADAHPACIALYDRLGKELVSKIPLSEAEFFAMVTAARKAPENNGLTGEFIAAAIREKLAKPADDGLDQLEMTCTRVKALLQLLSDKFDHLANHDATEFYGPEANHFCAGIDLMVTDAKAALTKSFYAVFHAAHGQPKEVAS
jgi:hypothetical protein